MNGPESLTFRRLAIRRKSQPSLHSAALVFSTGTAGATPPCRQEWPPERVAAGTAAPRPLRTRSGGAPSASLPRAVPRAK